MIRIGMDPMIFQAGVFALSWHGLFTFVGVVAAVVLVAWWARRDAVDPEEEKRVRAELHRLENADLDAQLGSAVRAVDSKTIAERKERLEKELEEFSRRKNAVTDIVFSVAVWAVLSGIVGAKIVHVIDYWDVYSQNPMQIFSRAGIALYGALLFGFLGGAGYIWARKLLGRIYLGEMWPWFRKLVGQGIAQGYLKGTMYAKFKEFSIGHLADVTAPALLIAQTIGRIGDIINGEHVARLTSLPWGFVYSHPDSPSYQAFGLNASHPAIAYEMLWNMVVLAIIWKLRGRLAPPGMLFALYLMLYSLGRFFIQFLRIVPGSPVGSNKVWFAGLSEAHIIALIVMAITVPLLAYKARWVRPAPAPAAQESTEPRSRRRG